MKNRLILSTTLIASLYLSVGCTGEFLECSPGDKRDCDCPIRSTGIERCTEDGTWGACKYCPTNPTDECTPGKVDSCDCENGNQGVRICRDSGESWGECEGCEDPEEPYEEGDYDATCIGDICGAPSECCENTVCGSVVFGSYLDSIENYCYPSCDPDGSEVLCDGGDICVDFGDDIATCLKPGEISFSDMILPVGVDYDTAVVVEGTDVDHTAGLGNDDFSFDIFYAYWNEYQDADDRTARELVIRADGLDEPDGIWNLIITVPEALIQQGVGSYPWYDEADETFNFSIDLYSGTLNDDFDYEAMWLESLTDDAVLDIDQTCDPCSSEDAECDVCEFSFDALLFGMKSKLDLSD